MHIRQGDKADQIARNITDYKLPSPEEIFYAMNYMEKKYKYVVFIITSDSKEWCTQHLQKHNVYISNMTLYEDFVLLSSCDHVIMTVGTFGWLAAWLTSQRGGTVVYYKDPFTVGSYLYKMYKRHNYFPGHWLAYNNNSVLQSMKLK